MTSSATWPAANRAIYAPVCVQQTVTVKKMALLVATQSGNLDVGIYSETGTRLVSSGSTAVAAAGLQSVDITDTTLSPGVYFLAMCVDNTTAAFTRGIVPVVAQQIAGVQQQAVGAVTLPATATFANAASAYTPLLFALTGSSVL